MFMKNNDLKKCKLLNLIVAESETTLKKRKLKKRH